MHTKMHTEMLDSQVFGDVTLRHKNLRHDARNYFNWINSALIISGR